MGKVRLGDYAVLYHGDAVAILPSLEDLSIDCILTDPPYGHQNNNGDLIHNREKALGEDKKRLVATRSGEMVKAGSKARRVHDAARPIANDDKEADVIFRKCLKHFPRLLSTGGCACCCCCGGGGPDPQFARWSLWLDKVLDFKQMVVWDKGPMGMGWHYRRSYETVLVATKPGGPCKWHDTTGKIENVIRPGHLGIRKIIPKNEELGLYGTCTTKVKWGEGDTPPCTDEKMALEVLLKKATSAITRSHPDLDLRWSIEESGGSITVRCRWDSISIISTEIKKIIEYQILNSSTHSPTKESIPTVGKTTKTDGGSRANLVAFSNWLKQTITTTNITKAYPQNVRNAAFVVLLRMSDERNWDREITSHGHHPTPKPIELATFFLKLHTKKGDTVLDPFMGAGWVGVACKMMERKFIGIEIDRHWFNKARERIESTRVGFGVFNH